MPVPVEIQAGALSRDIPCIACGHDHSFLPCDHHGCPCARHIRNGID